MRQSFRLALGFVALMLLLAHWTLVLQRVDHQADISWYWIDSPVFLLEGGGFLIFAALAILGPEFSEIETLLSVGLACVLLGMLITQWLTARRFEGDVFISYSAAFSPFLVGLCLCAVAIAVSIGLLGDRPIFSIHSPTPTGKRS